MPYALLHLLLQTSLLASPPAVRALPITGTLGTGPAMDVAVVGQRAYVIGRGRLHVVDIGRPDRPRVVGSVAGLGNTRQVAVDGGIAYVCSRESGVFIVDVRGDTPRLLTHYDSIEFATGVAVAGPVLFIAQRHYGVELVDVGNPRQPHHLSTIRTGEAQSVAYHGGLLYTGVWGTSEIVTADVRDARHPRIVSRTPLDGYGDGVAVQDGRLYAATGHHSRAAHREPGDPGFGHGHGLEVFSLADPERPALFGRVKFPQFYAIGFDMWDVQVVGTVAWVGDTHNGLFAVDVSRPEAPTVVAHTLLPKPTADAAHADYVGGFGLAGDYVYAAGGGTELHIIEAKGLAGPVIDQPGPALRITPEPAITNGTTYRPDGQVHAVALKDDVAFAACGSAGLHCLRVGRTLELVRVQPTTGVATDVCRVGERLYVAEGSGGMSIWQVGNDGRLNALARYQPTGGPVKYLAVPEPGRFALVQVGGNALHIVDVTDPSQPRLALADQHLGLLYGHQVCDRLLGGRYAAAFWHVTGLHWYDLGGDQPVYAGQRPAGRFDPLNGLDILDEQMVTPRAGGLVRFGQDEQRPLDDLSVSRITGCRLSGRPTVDGRRLALANRAEGVVRLLDIADFAHPRLLDDVELDGNPGHVAFTPTGMLIPAGYEGLLLREVTAVRHRQP